MPSSPFAGRLMARRADAQPWTRFVAGLEGFDRLGHKESDLGPNQQGDMMTVSRKFSPTAGGKTAGGRGWTRPAIQRLAAGSAEEGGTFQTDLGVNQS